MDLNKSNGSTMGVRQCKYCSCSVLLGSKDLMSCMCVSRKEVSALPIG